MLILTLKVAYLNRSHAKVMVPLIISILLDNRDAFVVNQQICKIASVYICPIYKQWRCVLTGHESRKIVRRTHTKLLPSDMGQLYRMDIRGYGAIRVCSLLVAADY